jgi:hypothetical protein
MENKDREAPESQTRAESIKMKLRKMHSQSQLCKLLGPKRTPLNSLITPHPHLQTLLPSSKPAPAPATLKDLEAYIFSNDCKRNGTYLFVEESTQPAGQNSLTECTDKFISGSELNCSYKLKMKKTSDSIGNMGNTANIRRRYSMVPVGGLRERGRGEEAGQTGKGAGKGNRGSVFSIKRLTNGSGEREPTDGHTLHELQEAFKNGGKPEPSFVSVPKNKILDASTLRPSKCWAVNNQRTIQRGMVRSKSQVPKQTIGRPSVVYPTPEGFVSVEFEKGKNENIKVKRRIGSICTRLEEVVKGGKHAGFRGSLSGKIMLPQRHRGQQIVRLADQHTVHQEKETEAVEWFFVEGTADERLEMRTSDTDHPELHIKLCELSLFTSRFHTVYKYMLDTDQHSVLRRMIKERYLDSEELKRILLNEKGMLHSRFSETYLYKVLLKGEIPVVAENVVEPIYNIRMIFDWLRDLQKELKGKVDKHNGDRLMHLRSSIQQTQLNINHMLDSKQPVNKLEPNFFKHENSVSRQLTEIVNNLKSGPRVENSTVYYTVSSV